MIKFPMFRRNFHSFRIGQFRELKDLRDLPELPFGSILHILDNFAMLGGTINFGPALDNPIINLNKYKLLVTNVTGYNPEIKEVAPVVNSKMILTSAGLAGQFMNYKRDMSPRVLYFDSIKDLPTRASAQKVVNYNSVFRARMMGVRRKPRFMNFLWALVINNIMAAPDQMHYIHVPIESILFERADFARVFRRYDRIATKYPEISTYLFLAHLYSILMKPVLLPPRGLIADDDDTLDAVEEFQIDPENWDPDITAQEFLTNVANYELGDPEAAMETLKIKDSENPYKVSIFEYLPTKMYEKINFILTCGGEYIIYNLRDLKELNGRNGAGIVRIIKHINLLAAKGTPVDMPAEEEEMVAEDIVSVDETGNSANQPEFVVPMTKEEKLDAIEQDMKELDDFNSILTATIPEQTKPMTQAQKEHVAIISKAYKKCVIGNKTFEEILSNIPEVDIELPPELLPKPPAGAGSTSSKLPPSKKGNASAPIPDVKAELPDIMSTTAKMDSEYVQKSLDRDLAAIITSFNKQGMFLVDFKEEEIVDDLNEVKRYTAKYEDVNHKKHTIKFTIPKMDKAGRFKSNGSYKTINKQRVNNPIAKVSDTRVTFNSNYNKMLLERNTNTAHSFINWFLTSLKKALAAGFKYSLKHGTCKYPLKAYPFELTEIGKRYTEMEFEGGAMHFDLYNRLNYVNPGINVDKDFEQSGYWFGYKGDLQFFMTVTGEVTVKNAKTNEEVFYGAFLDFVEWLVGIKLNSMTEYSELTILSKTIPLIHPLAYRYGLTNMLKYTGCDYEVFDINARVEKRTSDIIIKFSDKKLVIRRTPRNNALLFGGLSIYDFSDTMLEDMDSKDIYYEMLSQKKLSPNLIKGIDALFDLFIDPITRDVLREMKEPTDIRDLLLRANTMLTTTEHKDAASAVNFRFRGVEQMSGIVYNEMARAFATWKNRSIGATSHFSISEYQIKAKIEKNQLVENVSIINPIHDIKQDSKFSNAGEGGRSNETFLIPDRKFTDDQIGIVSEATVDNGKVGLNASLPFSPVIVNDRGMCVDVDKSKLKPENILSITSLLYPCVTQDDGKRKVLCAF